MARLAILSNNKVSNIIMGDIKDFPAAINIDELINVSIGDTYNGTTFDTLIEKPKVKFLNANVTSTVENGVTNYFGIHKLKQGVGFTLTADVNDPVGVLTNVNGLNIIIEKVVNQTTVVSDERFHASLLNGIVTIEAPDGFESTGNYMLTAKRQNEGLEYLGLPFEIEFEMVEFDVQRN